MRWYVVSCLRCVFREYVFVSAANACRDPLFQPPTTFLWFWRDDRYDTESASLSRRFRWDDRYDIKLLFRICYFLLFFCFYLRTSSSFRPFLKVYFRIILLSVASFFFCDIVFVVCETALAVFLDVISIKLRSSKLFFSQYPFLMHILCNRLCIFPAIFKSLSKESSYFLCVFKNSRWLIRASVI